MRFRLVIHAVGECFDFSIDRLKARIDAGEVLVGAGELADTRISECIYESLQLREAFAQTLFNAVETIIYMFFLHMEGV